MKPTDTKRILWENVAALMTHHWGETNMARLSRSSGVGLATCDRMKKQQTSVGIDILEAVAGVFELQAWHLLTPNLDPSNPPVIYLSRSEAALYDRFRSSARELAALNGN